MSVWQRERGPRRARRRASARDLTCFGTCCRPCAGRGERRARGELVREHSALPACARVLRAQRQVFRARLVPRRPQESNVHTTGVHVVACVATSAAASAAVLCRTRSATVKVRDVCRPRERTLDPVALGLQGLTGPKGDPGMQGPKGFAGPAAAVTVRDATGAIVGAWKPEPANAGQAVMTSPATPLPCRFCPTASTIRRR